MFITQTSDSSKKDWTNRLEHVRAHRQPQPRSGCRSRLELEIGVVYGALSFYINYIYIYIYIAIFCHGTSFKKKTSSHVGTRTSVAGISSQQICYTEYALEHRISSQQICYTLEHRIFVDYWYQRRWFESPRGQMFFFFNDVPWQNIAIYIIKSHICYCGQI